MCYEVPFLSHLSEIQEFEQILVNIFLNLTDTSTARVVTHLAINQPRSTSLDLKYGLKLHEWNQTTMLSLYGCELKNKKNPKKIKSKNKNNDHELTTTQISDVIILPCLLWKNWIPMILINLNIFILKLTQFFSN